jgi:antitoxin CcdA
MKKVKSAEIDGRRRPINLTLRADIVERAKRCGINVSQVAEQAVIVALREAERAVWQKENARAVEAQNERIDRVGLYNEGLRRF